MFEKEAEEAFKEWKSEQYKDQSTEEKLEFVEHLHNFPKYFEKTFKDGYNKANEWHFVKDGDLPEEDKSIMIYAKLADGVAVGKRRKQGKVYGWYFATYDGTFCLRDKEVIAWKDIVLPKLKED